ncbi:hypothetical protein PG999_005752 [Apiospora kogelbergensis]|uniref:Uncharacterized protein n=1 Tax=Apiospora kogelbergensis TaxID=1337665 RepID=A0AAW0QPE1_9PEZI
MQAVDASGNFWAPALQVRLEIPAWPGAKQRGLFSTGAAGAAGAPATKPLATCYWYLPTYATDNPPNRVSQQPPGLRQVSS